MSNKRLDIGDDEIRIIASDAKPRPRRRLKRRIAVLALAAAVAAAVVLWITRRTDADDYAPLQETVIEKSPVQPVAEQPAADEPRGYASRRDTTVNGTPLIIITPVNATARLIAGNATLADSAIVLAAQAADIRKDNGEIVGTFVLDGQLVSKGEAKAGYCSIVNGDISIGVADATPMLEQAPDDRRLFLPPVSPRGRRPDSGEPSQGESAAQGSCRNRRQLQHRHNVASALIP